MTQIGNGGPSYRNCAAGPFYGIYRLGDGTQDLVDNAAGCLRRRAVIQPPLTDDQWSRLTERLKNEEEISDEAFDSELEELYSGILPLGSQGCTYLHGIIVSGPHSGRVLNLDMDHHKPKFAFETNFLDWYERWLDEVIAGYLVSDYPTWFGYTMGGDAETLMKKFADATNREAKLTILGGLAKLKSAQDSSCRALFALCSEPDSEIRHGALRMLTKLAYPMAQEPLRHHILQDDEQDSLGACLSIFYYAREKSVDWFDLLQTRVKTVQCPKLFRAISNILKQTGRDFREELSPFCKHETEEIRQIAFSTLGSLSNKTSLVELFIEGLYDKSENVVLSTLQALGGVNDPRLLAAYAALAHRFKTDEEYILSNLEHRLKGMGYSSLQSFRDQLPE